MNAIFIVLLLAVCSFELGAGAHSCGKSKYKTRIVGGHESERLAWPWQAKLRLEYSSFRPGMGIIGNCGGSIIDQEWILTAAHCFNKDKKAKDLLAVKVLLGAHNISKSDEPSRVTLKAAKVIVHDGYHHPSKKDDIALIKLERPLELDGRDSQLAPVCLPEEGRETKDDECVATGWGTLSSGGKMASLLQEVNLPKIDDRKCKRVYGRKLSDKAFCAGYMSGGKDTCQGDSGGPLQCPMFNDVWVQEGVTSFGAGCAQMGAPGVYTKVADYLGWIKDVIKSENPENNDSLTRHPIKEPEEPIKEPEEPIKEPINIPINKPIKIPINEPIKIPINIPVNEPIKIPINIPVNEPIKIPINIPMDSSFGPQNSFWSISYDNSWSDYFDNFFW